MNSANVFVSLRFRLLILNTVSKQHGVDVISLVSQLSLYTATHAGRRDTFISAHRWPHIASLFISVAKQCCRSLPAAAAVFCHSHMCCCLVHC